MKAVLFECDYIVPIGVELSSQSNGFYEVALFFVDFFEKNYSKAKQLSLKLYTNKLVFPYHLPITLRTIENLCN